MGLLNLGLNLVLTVNLRINLVFHCNLTVNCRIPIRLAEDVVFAALKVCIKESCNTIGQCASMDDSAFRLLVAKHPVSHLGSIQKYSQHSGTLLIQFPTVIVINF